MTKFKAFLISAAALILLVSPAFPLTITSVSGSWSNWVGGENVVTQTASVVYGNTVEDQVRWGDVPPAAPKSGLGFTGVVDGLMPALSVEIDEIFELGQLRHFNNPIGSGSAADEVDLTIALAISELASGENFTFTFEIDETLNAEPCVYECNEAGCKPCPDRISFPNSFPSQSFVIDQTRYTLALLGFGDTPEDLIDDFISDEGGTNKTLLFGTLTESPFVIPEPASLLLIGGGLLGLAGFRRKKK
ncbi:MAG: THxN family PEP-CTERM protein [Candidatus Omnitrophota bacterium]